jgi:hypothetical protein
MRWVYGFVLWGCAVPLWAAAPVDAQSARKTYSAGEQVCQRLSLAALTGKSPWLVMGAGGAYEYATARAGQPVSFFGQPTVWGSILFLVVLVAFKDTVLTVFGPLKVPLDALAEVFHSAGGLLGVLYLGNVAFDGWPAWLPVPAFAAHGDLGLLALAVEGPSWAEQLGQSLLWLVMGTIHVAVWIVFNSVEVVILLNPIPFVDTLLKGLRTSIIGAIALASEVHPVLGLLLALPIILGSFWLLPFALRFGYIGLIFTTDVLAGLIGWRGQPEPPLLAFAGLGCPGVRLYTPGRLERTAQGLTFTYRPWFLLGQTTLVIPDTATLSTGIVSPVVRAAEQTWLRLPPRCCGAEQRLAERLQLGPVTDGSLRSTLGQALRTFTGWFWGRPPTLGTG